MQCPRAGTLNIWAVKTHTCIQNSRKLLICPFIFDMFVKQLHTLGIKHFFVGNILKLLLVCILVV